MRWSRDCCSIANSIGRASIRCWSTPPVYPAPFLADHRSRKRDGLGAGDPIGIFERPRRRRCRKCRAAPGALWPSALVAFAVLGSILEGIPAIVLFGPLLLLRSPRAAGVNEVHYAMVVVLAMGLGLFSPPFGVGYYTACAIGKVSPDAGLRAIWPYLGALVLGLLAVARHPVAKHGIPALTHAEEEVCRRLLQRNRQSAEIGVHHQPRSGVRSAQGTAPFSFAGARLPAPQ